MPKRALPCCRTSSRTVGDRRAWRKRFEGRCSLIATIPPRRDARAAESDGLENHCGASHRGFKSHSLRSDTQHRTIMISTRASTRAIGVGLACAAFLLLAITPAGAWAANAARDTAARSLGAGEAAVLGVVEG